MVMTLRKRVPPTSLVYESETQSETPPQKNKVSKPTKKPRRILRDNYSSTDSSTDSSDAEKENDNNNNGYENLREQRIRENKERMEKLGIFSLSTQFYNSNKNNNKKKNNKPPQRKRYAPIAPRPRRFSRAKNGPQNKTLQAEGISIPDDWKSEVYTEEDDKLLGDCETIWTLNKDGFGEDGERLYDFDGNPCHQCRQKIMGKLTYCGKCRTPQGQLCGDCLYTRYGENVLEAVQNPTWLCPVCRGICNCSRCRRTKGWQPVNVPYHKVIESGYKSIAHYLILTRRAGAAPKEMNDETVTIDLTTVETTAPQHYEGSDYSAESSESDSDDSDSEDDSKGEKKNKEQVVEMQVGTAGGFNEAAGSADGIQVP